MSSRRARGTRRSLPALEVYKALGAAENVSYWSDVSSGTHCGQRSEWSAPLRDNLQKFLTKSGNAPGVIEAAPSQSSNLADWVDWTTPTAVTSIVWV